MARRTSAPPPDPKACALRAAGALHPRPDTVHDELFDRSSFFDRRDRVQVKYEMLRRHEIDGRRVTEVARSFAVSRQGFYQVRAAFRSAGLPGLVPRPKGPRRAHKCTDDVLDFVETWRATQSGGDLSAAAAAVQDRFGITIHPRSLDRALARRKKKRAARRPPA